MEGYISNIRVAVLLFPLLSVALSLPYAIYQYRRYGSISLWKTLLVASFVFYMMCAYFMVILPLPADRSILIPSAQRPQLVPLHFLEHLSLPDASAGVTFREIIAFLRRPDVYTVYFNILLTVPFGVFLRYVFHRRWWQTILLGFGLSAFYEVSQLTGLFGMYEHPYRLFDVDDLITNTAGALLGFWLSIPLCRFLPNLRDVNERSLVRGSLHTSFTRRLLAFAIDMLVCAALLWLWRHVVSAGALLQYDELVGQLLATGVAFMLVPCLTRGQTIGHMVLRLRVVRPDGSSATPLSYIARYGLLFWAFLQLPLWLAALFPSGALVLHAGADELTVGAAAIRAVFSSVFVLWLVSVALRAAASAFRHPFVMLNGLMTNTRVMSESQIERLRAERYAQSLEDELAQNDLGAGSVSEAFDSSFDSVYSDELDAEIDEMNDE